MTDEQHRAAKVKDENDKTAGIAGAGAGVLAGAQVGTVLLPIPVIGTFTGALVGGILGTKIGKKVGPAIFNTFSPADRAQPGQTSHGKTDVIQELERLAKLHDAGIISDDEFKAAKAKLLGI